MNGEIAANEARLNVTWAGQNGDLPDPIAFDAADGDVKQWITEAVRNGSVPGVRADPAANFRDFVVDRFNANETRPYNLIQIRPKTPFGDPRDIDSLVKKLTSNVVALARETHFQKEEFLALVEKAWEG